MGTSEQTLCHPIHQNHACCCSTVAVSCNTARHTAFVSLWVAHVTGHPHMQPYHLTVAFSLSTGLGCGSAAWDMVCGSIIISMYILIQMQFSDRRARQSWLRSTEPGEQRLWSSQDGRNWVQTISRMRTNSYPGLLHKLLLWLSSFTVCYKGCNVNCWHVHVLIMLVLQQFQTRCTIGASC